MPLRSLEDVPAGLHLFKPHGPQLPTRQHLQYLSGRDWDFKLYERVSDVPDFYKPDFDASGFDKVRAVPPTASQLPTCCAPFRPPCRAPADPCPTCRSQYPAAGSARATACPSTPTLCIPSHWTRPECLQPTPAAATAPPLP